MRHQSSAGTRVLLDYKTQDTSDKTAVRTPSVDEKPKAQLSNRQGGNGRIRIGLIFVIGVLGVATAVKSMTHDSVGPRDTTASAVGVSAAATVALAEITPPPIKTTPKVVFRSADHIEPRQALPDVPLVQVGEDGFTQSEFPESGTRITKPKPLTVAPSWAQQNSFEPSLLEVTVKKGDTLYDLLLDQGLSVPTIAQISSLPDVTAHLVNVRPGQKLLIALDAKRKFKSLTHKLDISRTLLVTRADSGERFIASVNEEPLTRHLTANTLTLDSSLYLAGTKAGLPESLIMETYSIFQWTVDFNREVRGGDKLHLLYEAFYKDGTVVKYGDIVAAEYESAKRRKNAYRYVVDGNARYYSDDGQSLTRRFLRNPIKARITSRFDPLRKHPILHTIRAHKGVDYGAPIGTPISAAGDGRVAFLGVKGGFGNTVIIQHGDRYSTLYAHLHKFPAKLKKGSHVKQGSTIGFVGKSGLATGAHLHYEFRVDNIHRDPQKVKLPGAPPLSENQLFAFREAISSRQQKIASLRAGETSDTLAMR